MLPESVTQAIAAGAGSRRIQFIGIHTAGTPGGDLDVSAAAIRAFHTAPKPKGNGWLDIGYNFVVRKSGLVELGRPLARVPAHIEGFNTESIGVCFSGNGDVADFNPAQRAAGLALLAALCTQFTVPVDHVIGHREAPAFGAAPTKKTCPGTKVDMTLFRAALLLSMQYGPPVPP
jgi:N-acetylmuramoyl-L-alanine amidase